MKITLSQVKCHLITIYCFILMIQSYYNIYNAKTLNILMFVYGAHTRLLCTVPSNHAYSRWIRES